MQKRLLIIDDDRDIRDMLQAFFESNDYQVSSIGSVDDIFKVFSEHQPDLILLDYRLPEDNGAKICLQLKSNPGTFHVPIIMISGFSKETLEQDYHGWDAIVSKPFDLTELHRIVANFLSNR